MMHLIAAPLAVEMTRREIESALPGAPVVEERPVPARPPGRRRLVLADTLRRAADRLEPPRPVDCSPQH